jgi:hypothetical protein
MKATPWPSAGVALLFRLYALLTHLPWLGRVIWRAKEARLANFLGKIASAVSQN